MSKDLLLGALGIAIVAGLLVFGGSFIGKSDTKISDIEPILNKLTEKFGAISSPFEMGPTICGSDVCWQFFKGTCANATTTLFSFVGPTATSTLDYFQVQGTMGTTTGSITVATTTTSGIFAATTAGTSTAYGGYIISTGANEIATSTKFSIFMGDKGTSAGVSAGTATLTRMVYPPSTRFSGFSTSTYWGAGTTAIPIIGGWTGNSNTFECTYSARFSYTK